MPPTRGGTLAILVCRDLALHDALTGLANRVLFTEELGRALLRANRKGTHVGILFADLDGFKPINDVYGHRVGDRVLQIVAERLTETLRRADLTARLGGDEFAIIVEDLKSVEQAKQITESVSKLLESPIVIDNTAMPLGISSLHFYTFGGLKKTVEWINTERESA